jgi:DMSO/TMAO reductase YedYZ molybdopterin-dependent catalytic subunit
MIGIPQTPTPAPLQVKITGLVDNPLTLTANNVSDFPQYGRASTMVCPDGAYETEQATWQGVLLSDLFKAAQIRPKAQKFTVYSDFDGYKQTFKLRELEHKDIFLAITKDKAQKFTVYSDFDGYKQTFKLRELEHKDIFLAITKDERPMTFYEGAPARIVVHEEWGFRWVRWVNRIEVTE